MKYHNPIQLDDAQRAIRTGAGRCGGVWDCAGPYWDVGIFGGRAFDGDGGDDVRCGECGGDDMIKRRAAGRIF